MFVGKIERRVISVRYSIIRFFDENYVRGVILNFFFVFSFGKFYENVCIGLCYRVVFDLRINV